RRVVDDYRSAWPRRQFRLVGDELGCCAHAKELWVEQILSNLVSNAVKYSPPDGPVDVVVSHTGGDIAISVRDHGCGIHTQELDGRSVSVHVEDNRVVVEIDDPDLADLMTQALALRPAEAHGAPLSGEAPAAVSFSGIWAAARNAAGDVFLRLAEGRASSRGA